MSAATIARAGRHLLFDRYLTSQDQAPAAASAAQEVLPDVVMLSAHPARLRTSIDMLAARHNLDPGDVVAAFIHVSETMEAAQVGPVVIAWSAVGGYAALDIGASSPSEGAAA